MKLTQKQNINNKKLKLKNTTKLKQKLLLWDS